MTIARTFSGFLVALLGLGLAASVAFAQAPPRFPKAKITYEEWRTYFNEVANKPSARRNVSGDEFVVDIPDEYAVYFFTTPKHPAHPAVIRRLAVAGEGGKIGIQTTAHYAGNRLALDKWFNDVRKRTPAPESKK